MHVPCSGGRFGNDYQGDGSNDARFKWMEDNWQDEGFQQVCSRKLKNHGVVGFHTAGGAGRDGGRGLQRAQLQ